MRPMTASTVHVVPLGQDEVDLAYPLVALDGAAVSLESWRGQAFSLFDRRAGGQPCGVMTARRRGQIRGLFTYEVAAAVSPTLLCVGHLSVGEPLESLVPWDRLLGSIVDLGREHACAAVHIGLSRDRSWLLDRWPDPKGLDNPIPVACTITGGARLKH